MQKGKLALLFASIIILLITVFSAGIPFLWDTAYHSAVASHFISHGFNWGLAPKGLSNGNPALYSGLLVLSWTVFGKTLLVSHIFFAFILLFLLGGFIKLSNLFVADSVLPWLVILLFADPSFLAQSMLMGYDILLMGFITWATWAVITKRRGLAAVLLAAMVLTHFRGIIGVGIIILLDMFIHRGMLFRKIRLLWIYVPAAILLAAWAVFHWSQNGFFLISSSNDSYIGQIPLSQWIRNVVYILWKTIDLGRVFFWIILAIIILHQHKKLDEKDKLILLLIISPQIYHIIFFSGSMVPVSHRYFMMSQLFLIIAIFRMLRFYKEQLKYWFAIAGILVLLSGNLWFYPQRFGNAWDASLVFLSWPEISNQLDEFIESNDIERNDIMAEYPLNYRHSEMWLDDDTSVFRVFRPSETGDTLSSNILLITNFSNMYKPDLVADIEGGNLLWQSEKGRIQAKLIKYPQ